ncbi:MAG: hypothetical protein WA081_06150 [Desulfosalsimonadaceae bacterium]
MERNKIKWLGILFLIFLTNGCSSKDLNPTFPVSDEKSLFIAQKLMQAGLKKNDGNLRIQTPYDESLFPPEMAAPVFEWEDNASGARHWLVAVEMHKRRPLYFFLNQQEWLPDKDTWESVKRGSVDFPAIISVIGFGDADNPAALSKNRIRMFTSKDRVDALILYRQVQLPFMEGEKNFRKMKWRLGDLSSYEQPPVIMENIPVCASCHQASADGKSISMELNYKNDSGAQFITPVKQHIALSGKDFMTWSDFPKPGILPNTRGLFARLSPSGRYIAGTVNEVSFVALTNDPAFCQVFFPTYGFLACYDVAKKTFYPLNGADNYDFIQTNPDWSPDEKYIAFARAETKNAYHEDFYNIKTRIENRGPEALNREFPIQFDIWRLPFNNGRGGTPEPLAGASGNGMSNYFARHSPDGRWIVFTQSRSGIMLQPDSRLYIVPSAGGKARKMHCNQNRFNSWHSWSSNGKWLIFSSNVDFQKKCN